MGDGAFQMSMPELGTLNQYQVPVKLIVFHNEVLGLVRQYQHFTYKDHFTMVDLDGNPDLSLLAEAYRLPYFSVHRDEEAEKQIQDFLKEKGSGILEVFIDRNEVA